MSLMNSTGERLRRATQLWHTYLAATGQRFELAQFLKDPAIEKQTLDGALASGDLKLIALGTGLAARHRPGGAGGGRVARRGAVPGLGPGRGSRRTPQAVALPARRALIGAARVPRHSAQKKRRANARRFHRARN